MAARAMRGCNENVARTRPELIRRMHTGFLEVGADIIETASFQASPIVLAEYGLEPETREINRLAATLAREEAARFSTADRPRFVAGLDGPGRPKSFHLGHRRRHRSIRCATATKFRPKD